MEWIEVLKALLFGIVEGITEWLPVSSTGHMILLDEFVTLNLSQGFKDMFLVVIQLGAIIAVAVMFWTNIWPFPRRRLRDGTTKFTVDRDIIRLWLKIIVSCVPAAIIGVFFNKQIKRLFYNYTTVAIMLILFGVLFIIIEKRNESLRPKVLTTDDITWKLAIWIGVFQVIAAVFPGTSRSGATILGGILLGLSRPVAAEFTFYLAIPVMFGASFLELLQLEASFTAVEWVALLVGMGTAYVVSYLCIDFLMRYVKRHDFKVFGWYRIALGIVVLLWFMAIKPALA